MRRIAGNSFEISDVTSYRDYVRELANRHRQSAAEAREGAGDPRFAAAILETATHAELIADEFAAAFWRIVRVEPIDGLPRISPGTAA